MGTVFTISGLPPENSEKDIEELMKEISWPVTVIPGSKRIKARMASIRVRAMEAPPKNVIRVNMGRELYTVYVQEYAPPQKPQTQSQQTQAAHNLTWADALRSTLGRDQAQAGGCNAAPTQAQSQAQQSRDPRQEDTKHIPGMGQARFKRGTWAEQMEEQGFDGGMDTSSESSEASFKPWDLFDMEERAAPKREQDQTEQEEGPPARKKARKTGRKTSSSQKGRRIKVLEQGFNLIQQQMSQLMGALQQKNVVEVRAGPQRGSMPWPEGMSMPEDAITKVPGDGNCLWHALAVCKAGAAAVGQLPKLGLESKKEYLDWMGGHGGEVAELWGCGEEAIPAVVQLWQEDWADGRALLLASWLNNVSVLLFNAAEQKIEVFHAANDPVLSGTVWAVMFNGGHYDSIRTPTRDDLSRIRSVITMLPWKHSSKNPLKGGSSSLPPVVLSKGGRRRKILRDAKKRSRESRDKGQKEVSRAGCMTWNVGGLRTNLSQLLSYLSVHEPAIACIQEVRLAREQQGSIQRLLVKRGYQSVWGAPAGWGKNRRGQPSLLFGETPGVAILCKLEVPCSKVTFNTAGGRELERQGRMVAIRIARQNLEPITVMTLYAPSGNNRVKERELFYATVEKEISTRAHEHVILTGDFNVTQNRMIALLQCSRGGCHSS